jgi:hypothetical protein
MSFSLGTRICLFLESVAPVRDLFYGVKRYQLSAVYGMEGTKRQKGVHEVDIGLLREREKVGFRRVKGGGGEYGFLTDRYRPLSLIGFLRTAIYVGGMIGKIPT